MGRPPSIDGNRIGTATWWWDEGPVDPSTTRFLREQGVTDVFWSLPWTGPADHDRAGIGTLRRNGMVVNGLGGDRRWAVDPGLAEEWAQRVVADGTVVDLHLDIEPWTWMEPPAPLPELLEGLAEAVRRVALHSRVEVDLPPWIADDHPRQFKAICTAAEGVSLLAYRDRAASVLSCSATARVALASYRRPYRVAVETRPAAEPHITFADDGRRVLDRELAILRRELAVEPWFRGLAMHDVKHWRSLAQ